MAVPLTSSSPFPSFIPRPSTARPSHSTEHRQSSVSSRSHNVPEFVPRSHPPAQSTRHRQCSHMSNANPDHAVCALDQLLHQDEATTPPLKDERSESLSSTSSSSSLHTHSAVSTGGYYGQGQGWIQPSLWGPPAPFRSTKKPSSAKAIPRLEDEGDRYHLLSMAEGIVDDQIHSDIDPMFNPSLNGLPGLSPLRSPMPPQTRSERPLLDPTQLSPEQIAALVASFSPTSQQSPIVAQLVARATRLAKGLAQPPPNRGFRPKANELPDQDESNTTVFVGGLSQGVTESILHDIFAPFGSIAYVSPLRCRERMITDSSGQGPTRQRMWIRPVLL